MMSMGGESGAADCAVGAPRESSFSINRTDKPKAPAYARASVL